MKGVNLSMLSAFKEAIHFFKEIRGVQNNVGFQVFTVMTIKSGMTSCSQVKCLWHLEGTFCFTVREKAKLLFDPKDGGGKLL
jgi:hypothetical protein